MLFGVCFLMLRRSGRISRKDLAIASALHIGSAGTKVPWIKCRDAIEFYVAQFKPPVTSMSSQDGVENADRLTAAMSQIDEATATYKTAQNTRCDMLYGS